MTISAAEATTMHFDHQLLADANRPRLLREAEWLRVYRHFNPRLESFFGRRVSSASELSELVADIWRRVLLNIHSLRAPEAMWAWLTTIGTNLLRDRARSDRVRRSRELSWEDAVQDPSVSAFLDGMAQEGAGKRADFPQVLASLDEQEREFLELYAIDGLSHDEIAQVLKLPSASASRQRLRRLRQRVVGSLSGIQKEP